MTEKHKYESVPMPGWYFVKSLVELIGCDAKYAILEDHNENAGEYLTMVDEAVTIAGCMFIPARSVIARVRNISSVEVGWAMEAP